MALVMVVDDAPDTRSGMAKVLARRGHEPLCAATGLEAVEALRRRRPDLVILDVAMPGMDGVMVLEWMRRTPDLRRVPVLVYSAAADEGDRWRAQARGAEYVEKGSVSWQELAERVDQLLPTQAPSQAGGPQPAPPAPPAGR